jgi:hypothetical protein
MEIWDTVQSVQDFIDCNIKFISGDLPATPYYDAQLAQDSVPLSRDLIKLHKYGVLTVDGQGSLIEHNKTINEDIVSIEQKPYLCCFIPKKFKQELIQCFKKHPHIVYIVCEDDEDTITNISGIKYNVTRKKKNLDDWNLCTNLWTDHQFISTFTQTFHDHEFLFEEISDKYIYADITCKEYGSATSIEKFLLSFFKSTV